MLEKVLELAIPNPVINDLCCFCQPLKNDTGERHKGVSLLYNQSRPNTENISSTIFLCPILVCAGDDICRRSRELR